MKPRDCKAHWALVTGASSGIGREFCVQLAGAGMNVAMVARRKPRMEQLAAELHSRHGIRTHVLEMDLGQPEAAAAIRQQLEREGIRIRLLCNCAGFWFWGEFETAPPDCYERMVQVNAASLAALCREFLPDLASFPASAVINVSSPAALQPVPYLAVYAATKAFVHSFSQALHEEWKRHGVHVQTLVPGPTDTEFDVATAGGPEILKKRGSAADVVAVALSHLDDGAPLAVTAAGTYRQRLFAALFPARIVLREVARMFKPNSR